MPALLNSRSFQVNLYRLFTVRAVFFALQLLALFYAYYQLALNIDYGSVLGVMALLGIVNALLFLRLRRSLYPSQREFFLHLLVDVVGLSLLLFFTGGASNPFISYLLVPITIAATTLPRRYAVLLSTCALACYTTLLYFYEPLLVLDEKVDSAGMHSIMTSRTPSLHIVGMWFNFTVSATLIVYFITKLVSGLRQRETRLSQYREETLRNEQVLAVATQAAGTAHTLGTPLATMAVLLKELQREYQHNLTLNTDLQTLQNQVKTCRETLQNLVRKADFKQQQILHTPLSTFIHELMQDWQLLRPEVPCSIKWPEAASPTIVVDSTLKQALINLLNNAADASPAGIEITVLWQSQHWDLHIRDYGEGISPAVQEQLGSTIISSKPEGLGVGLLLSQATLTRLGGSVRLYPQQPGTLTLIELPLVVAHAS